MTWPSHLLLSMGGPLYDVDDWSMGIRLSIPTGLNQNPFHDEIGQGLDDLAEDIRTWWVGNTNIQTMAAQLAFIKLNAIGPDGKYRDSTQTHAHYWTGTLPATGYTPVYPSQVSLAVTWMTDAERGRASKGRVFLPAPRLSVNTSTGILEAADVLGVANRMASLVNSINDWPGWDLVSEFGSMRVCVVSGLGDGTIRPVTGVRVGRVLDTQRRRRSSLDEGYQTATTAISG
jgi:hypothetical protein